MVTPEIVLSRLPVYRDEWRLVKKEQYVPDIIREITRAHREYGPYYDTFSDLFYNTNPGTLADDLYDFCKRNIAYREEKVEFQSTSVPTGILTRGYGDCKHYALFNAGVIGSLNRLYNCGYEAYYYFVSYKPDSEPYHVFVSLVDRDQEIWIDPTPGSGGTPVLIEPKII